MKTIENGILLEEPISIWLPSTKEIDSAGRIREEWEIAEKYRVKIKNAKSYKELVEALKDLKNYIKAGEYWKDPILGQTEIYTGDGYYVFESDEDDYDGREYWYTIFYKNKNAELFQLLTGAAAYRDTFSGQKNASFDLGMLLNNEVPKWEYGKPYILPCEEDIRRAKRLIEIIETRTIPVSEAKFILETCYPQFALFATKGLDCIELEPIEEKIIHGSQKDKLERNHEVYTLAKRFNNITHS